MSMNKAFEIASSALTANSQRLNAVASNLANAESVSGPDGQVYQGRKVVFESYLVPGATGGGNGVRVREVLTDPSPPKRIYDPKHPMADAEGYLSMPNVEVVDEMVDMIAASRAYQTNVEVMNTAKTLMQKTLTLGT
ncbi:MAG: flagellar basal body rod protein FlgC [Alcaligenaceae bacterium]|nr:flagellar basal body rod protein FlgC [Alcaligenaceae bacterium SAGV5]MPS50374.1 flagellar basal body rod protein FlgC [Alcaligenaceae bacterium SAGV3]MPT57480.1 flagellar basal body rod protein FlgC [Alcaligenaceae bacterium]